MRIGDEEVLTLKQAAERIGVSHITLQQQARKGTLTAQMLGKQWVVTAADLAAYARDYKGKHGFANPNHPLYGTRGGGGRRKRKPASDT
jgi:excisionase family DNA binding protein